MDIEDCIHEEIEDGACITCGLIMGIEYTYSNEFSKNYSKINSNKQSLIETIEGIHPDVITKVKENIKKKQQLTGKKIRNDCKNTFIELYNGYLETGITFKPNELAKKLNLSRKDINWCLKVSSGTSLSRNFNEDEDKKYASIVIISPVSFIESICKNNDMLGHKDELKRVTRDILDQKDILFSSKPEYVSFAIVKKYAELNGLNVKSFSKKNKISDNALKKSIEDIKFYFN